MVRLCFVLTLLCLVSNELKAQNCYEYGPDVRVCDSFITLACGGSRCSASSSPCNGNPNPTFRIKADDYWMDDPANPGNKIPHTEPGIKNKADGKEIVDMPGWDCHIVGTCHCQPDDDFVMRCYMDLAGATPVNGMSAVLGGPNCGPPGGGGGMGP